MPTTAQTQKDRFLGVYEDEHQRTMRVLRAYPPDKAELKAAPSCKSARELAWIFVIERGMGTKVWHDEFAKAGPSGTPPPAPEKWADILQALEKAHKDFADLIRKTPDADLNKTVRFFVGPKAMGDIPRIDFAWFLLHDQIHHRGQLSVYLRMAGGKVPSIYGPSGDEPWF